MLAVAAAALMSAGLVVEPVEGAEANLQALQPPSDFVPALLGIGPVSFGPWRWDSYPSVSHYIAEPSWPAGLVPAFAAALYVVAAVAAAFEIEGCSRRLVAVAGEVVAAVQHSD